MQIYVFCPHCGKKLSDPGKAATKQAVRRIILGFSIGFVLTIIILGAVFGHRKRNTKGEDSGLSSESNAVFSAAASDPDLPVLTPEKDSEEEIPAPTPTEVPAEETPAPTPTEVPAEETPAPTPIPTPTEAPAEETPAPTPIPTPTEAPAGETPTPIPTISPPQDTYEPAVTLIPAPAERSARLVEKKSVDVTLNGLRKGKVKKASASKTIDQSDVNNDPIKAFDNDETTNWQEGDTNGPGIGESIAAQFETEEPVWYITLKLGNWKKEKNYYDGNNRPKTLRIEMSGFDQTITFPEERWKEFCVELNEPCMTKWIKFTIKDVYRGNQWNDTVISDIQIYCK